MWRVSKGDNVLWIIGTQTPVPQKMTWRAKGLEAIVAQSRQVLREPTAGVSMKQIGYFTALTMLPSALQLRKNPDDATLKDIVPAELYARWLVLRDKYIDSYLINDEEKNIERWRPMFAALELYKRAIDKAGLTSANPVWPVVRDAARGMMSPPMELRDVFALLDATPVVGDGRVLVEDLVVDARRVGRGSVFFCVRGFGVV